MLRNDLNLRFHYHSELQRLALTELELFAYIKAGVIHEIEEYLSHYNDDVPITKNISIYRTNSWRPTVTAGEAGKTRAILYKEYINKMESLEELLRGLLFDLNNAADKNEEKTLDNLPIQVINSVASFFYRSVQGAKDRLGNSDRLARNIALALTFMFNIDRSKVTPVHGFIRNAGAVDSELKALVISLHRVIDPVLQRLAEPVQRQAVMR